MRNLFEISKYKRILEEKFSLKIRYSSVFYPFILVLNSWFFQVCFFNFNKSPNIHLFQIKSEKQE